MEDDFTFTSNKPDVQYIVSKIAMVNVYIECGTTLNSPYTTGIQRVVRSIIRESEMVGPQLGVTCIPVIFSGGEFHISERRKAGRKEEIEKAGVIAQILQLALRVDKRLSGCCLKKIYPRIRSIFSPLVRHLYQFSRRTLNAKTGIDSSHSVSELTLKSPTEKRSATESSNILLLLDSTWSNDMWAAVDRFRASGGQACAVLYDLIPFTHPETVEEHTRQAHTSWWSNVPMHVDSVMCISKTVRNQFLQWQNGLDLVRKIPEEKVDYFYLGSDININGDDDSSSHPLASSEMPYFLVVGSIEPRKNHRVILDAFDLLWKTGVSAKLIIVGGHGWKSEQFLSRVNDHTMKNTHLFLLDRVSDSELNGLYKNSASLIFASLEEGFGLPIVEAFLRGADVICSDIPVFHEIAGQRATYFDPCSSEHLAKVVAVKVERGKNTTNIIMQSDLCITWRKSAEQLFTRICSNAAINGGSESEQ